MRRIPRRFACALFVGALALGAPGSPRAAQADEGDDRFQAAADHYRAERWQQASDAFGQLLAEHPDHARANQGRFFHGEALSQLGRFAEAQQQFAELRRRDPDSRYARQALFRGGETGYLAGDYAAARRDLLSFREKYPDDALDSYALPYLAAIELRANNAAEARRLFTLALAQHPKGPLADDCRLGLGLTEEIAGQLDAAQREYETLSGQDSPLADQALLRLGMLANARGQHAPALEAFERLEKKSPQSQLLSESRLGRGYALLKLARHDEAAAVLGPLGDDPKLSVEAHYYLGLSQRAREDWAGAADTLLAGGQRDPAHKLSATLGFHAADSLWRAGKADAAREQFAHVLNTWPDSPWADDCQLGQVRIAAERRENAECVRLADELAAKFPDSPFIAEAELAKSEASYQLAETAYAAGDLKLAGELFTALVNADPASPRSDRALSGLAWCRFKASQWADAAETCQQLLATCPDSPLAPDAALLRGQALERLQDIAGARATYRTVIDRYATSDRQAEALWRAARLEDDAGQTAAAGELYGQLVEKHADFAELDAALYRRGVLLAGDQPSAGEETLLRLRRDFPRSRFTADATLRLAERAITGQKFDDASSLLGELITAETPAETRQHALYLAGRSAVAARDWQTAETRLQQLLDEYPANELALPAGYLLAEASFNQGHYEQAVQRLDDLSERTKDDPQPWSATAELRRAQALAQLKEWDRAQEIASSIAARFPGFAEQHQYEADYLIGRARAAAADLSGAREAYARVIASPAGKGTQTAAMAQWMLGESYFHQEDYPAALGEFAKLDERYPFAGVRSAALLETGKCHEYLNDWPAAVAAYEKLLRDYPASELGSEASDRLADAERHVATAKRKPE